MPVPLYAKIHKEHGISKSKLEKYWTEAKEAAAKSYEPDNPKHWGTVMIIFKHKLKKHQGISIGRDAIDRSDLQTKTSFLKWTTNYLSSLLPDKKKPKKKKRKKKLKEDTLFQTLIEEVLDERD